MCASVGAQLFCLGVMLFPDKIWVDSLQGHVASQFSLQRCTVASSTSPSVNLAVTKNVNFGFSSSSFGAGSQQLRIESTTSVARKNLHQSSIRATQVHCLILHYKLLLWLPLVDSWVQEHILMMSHG